VDFVDGVDRVDEMDGMDGALLSNDAAGVETAGSAVEPASSLFLNDTAGVEFEPRAKPVDRANPPYPNP